MRILLNGVGRIGKAILRFALNVDDFDIVAVNELNSNIKNIAYSINYDSTYGRLDDIFEAYDDYIENSSCKIEILNKQNLGEIDFKKHDIDFVIDASGSKVDMQMLKALDVKALFLTHPNKNADINVVLGVNDDQLNLEKHKIISTSSCNATAILPILKMIDDNFGISSGDITTIHPYLNHQKTLDGGCIGSSDRDVQCNFEFGRSATQNIIPSKTTTIDACSYIMPNINKTIISSSSFRVPTSTVGAINITLFIKQECTKEKLIELCKEYEQNQKYDIVLNSDEALVSSDFQAQKFTTIIDHRFMEVKMDNMIKLTVWYDNEWGYASKVVEIVQSCLSKETK